MVRAFWVKSSAAVTAFVAAASISCCGSPSHSASPSGAVPALSVQVPRVDAREVRLPASWAADDGNLRLTPLGAECGLTYLIGTHAEVDYHGQVCRLRLAVTNIDDTFHSFDTSVQRLVDTSGQAVAPDTQAMAVKRQVLDPMLGAGDTDVIALYFALKPGRVPKTVVLHGDNDPSGIEVTPTSHHVPGGVQVPLPKTSLYTPKSIF